MNWASVQRALDLCYQIIIYQNRKNLPLDLHYKKYILYLKYDFFVVCIAKPKTIFYSIYIKKASVQCFNLMVPYHKYLLYNLKS